MMDGAHGVSQHHQAVVKLDKEFVIIHKSVDMELIAEALIGYAAGIAPPLSEMHAITRDPAAAVVAGPPVVAATVVVAGECVTQRKAPDATESKLAQVLAALAPPLRRTWLIIPWTDARRDPCGFPAES